MYLKIAGLVLSFGFSQWAAAAITVVVPEEVVVVSINQKEIKPSFLRTAKNYQVDANEVTILARYQQYFDHQNSQHDILKSDVVVIHAKNLVDQQKYDLKLVDAPKDFDSARKYVEQPKIALINAQKEVVSTQLETQIKTPSILNQLFAKDSTKSTVVIPALTSQQTTGDGNRNDVSNGKGTVFTVPNKTSPSSTLNALNTSPDQQLIQIWQQATEAERQKFLSWLAQH